MNDNNQNIPAIIIAAYKRPAALKRLLGSIAKADFGQYSDIPLVICIDKGNNNSVIRIAENFDWAHGTKTIIKHEKRLGLKNNILSCGNLTEQYDSVIILEDDLLVSPAFYDYTVQAINFFDDNRIAGISLYGYNYNEYSFTYFFPVDDGYDNYFMQSATSWGQAWTKHQWRGFKHWYKENNNTNFYLNSPKGMPSFVNNWADTSWKKYFIKYMIENEKYFVCPRQSLTTNMGDAGTHHAERQTNFQTPLLMAPKAFNFAHYNESKVCYDAFYELSAASLSEFDHFYQQYDFNIDLMGIKKPEELDKEYLLSIRKCTKPIKSFGIALVPIVLNVIYQTKGDEINFGKRADFQPGDIPADTKLNQLVIMHKMNKLHRIEVVSDGFLPNEAGISLLLIKFVELFRKIFRK